MPINIESLSLALQEEIETYNTNSKTSSIYQVSTKNKVSDRYASALFQLAKDVDKINEIENDLKIFYSTIFANKETFAFFSRPFTERSVKINIITKVYKNNVLEESFNFLCILIERNIIHLLSNILEDYVSQRNEHYNIAQVHVQTAFPIKNNRSIIEAAHTLAGREVDVDITVNPDLIGGITVEIDGIIYDYSIKMALDDMNKKLLNIELGDSDSYEY